MVRVRLLAAVGILLAARSLRSDPPPAGIDFLTARLKDQQPEVRKSAADELARRGVEAAPAVPALTLALQDKREEVRIAAAVAMGNVKSGARSGVPELRRLLRQDASAPVQRWAAWALGEIGAEADAVVPELLDTAMRFSRRESATANDALIRDQALTAVARFRGDAVPALQKALHNEKQRATAIAALTRFGVEAEPVIPDLLTALKDGTAESAPVFQILGHMGNRAVPALAELLDNPDVDIAQRAMSILGNCGDDALPAMADALQHRRAAVREAVCETLYYQTQSRNRSIPAHSERTASLIPALLPFSRHPSATMRRHALVTLCQFGGADRAEVLLALRDPDPDLRAALCLTLGGLGEQAPGTARLAVAERLDDADPMVRLEAAEAMMRIDRMTPRITALLSRSLLSERGDVRYRAVLVVWSMREDCQFAEPALTYLRWFDPDRRVRRLASRLLRKIQDDARS
jgi:HEAT repeat protein